MGCGFFLQRAGFIHESTGEGGKIALARLEPHLRRITFCVLRRGSAYYGVR